ncbi:MAG TPA: efflux RND transporter periplasmic adaptor subunit, partial [Gammaproteobacteria bacterium]|nr:efflux RND transporter periplasmic adaptor subunit [Gammaproteobacteria bacterium]
SKVYVDVGARVQKNDLLLELDDRPYRFRVTQARKRTTAAQADLGEAKREKQRAVELFDRTVLSIRDQDLVEIALAKTRAELAAASSELRQAELDLEYSRIRAPYAGVIVGRYVSAGETVVQSQVVQPMLKIVRSGSMAAVALVSEQNAARLSLGVALQVGVNGRQYSGRITQLGYELQSQEAVNGYQIKVVFDLPDAVQLRQGQRASIILR